MITGLLWAIAIGVWLLLLVVASAVGRATATAKRLSTGLAQWAVQQQQQQSGVDAP